MKLRAVAIAAVAALALACAGASAQNSNQGVSKNEIVIGSIQDLSGPIAGFGKQVRLGMMLRVDEINEQGGINGRKLRLIVEDSAYDPKKAVLAAQKLVNQDKIFAMVAHIGTAQNLAAITGSFSVSDLDVGDALDASVVGSPVVKLDGSAVKNAQTAPKGRAFMKALTPSSALAAVVGAKALPRTEVTKKLWAYIKKNGLQDKVQKRNIHADDKLKPVFGGKKTVNMFEMTKLVNKHLS